jgi:hypothetical protein
MSGITFEDEFFGFLDGAIHQQKRLADRAMGKRQLMTVMSVTWRARRFGVASSTAIIRRGD